MAYCRDLLSILHLLVSKNIFSIENMFFLRIKPLASVPVQFQKHVTICYKCYLNFLAFSSFSTFCKNNVEKVYIDQNLNVQHPNLVKIFNNFLSVFICAIYILSFEKFVAIQVRMKLYLLGICGWFNHSKTGPFSPVFEYHSNTGPFDDRTQISHLNTGLVRYSDGHCTTKLF